MAKSEEEEEKESGILDKKSKSIVQEKENIDATLVSTNISNAFDWDLGVIILLTIYFHLRIFIYINKIGSIYLY